MKKLIWITFGAALVLVNLAAWLAEQFSGFHVEMFFRLAFILGITVVTTVFAGAFMLVNKFEEEVPKTGHSSDSLRNRTDATGGPGDEDSRNAPP